MATSNFEQVLKEARKLPRRVQAELAEALLEDVRATSKVEGSVNQRGRRRQNRIESGLETLSGVNTGELQTLASAILAPGRQRRLQSLLQKNKSGNLKPEEAKELDAILEECDRIALIKAKARYTLMLSEKRREAMLSKL